MLVCDCESGSIKYMYVYIRTTYGIDSVQINEKKRPNARQLFNTNSYRRDIVTWNA